MNTLHPLIFRYLGSVLFGILMTLGISDSKANDPPPYAAYFNPDKGFKSVQGSLQMIFLQLAGSLEHYGTPEPYIRHVMTEHGRVDAKYFKATGRHITSQPPYLTNEYIESLAKNWNQMSPVLTLEPLCKTSGRNLRYAIMGSWNMAISEMVAAETSLTKEEAASYRAILKKDYFTKADFPMLEKFYQSPYDKLTEQAKNELSVRTWRGTQPPDKRDKAIQDAKGGTLLLRILNQHQDNALAYFEDRKAPKANADDLQETLITQLKLNLVEVRLNGLDAFERDALYYSHLIRAAVQKRIDHVQAQMKNAEEAKAVAKALTLTLENLVVLAQMEFEDAMFSTLADKKPSQH
jgi:hypothetical protein